MKEKKYNKDRGITLVALVITIIILLILSGIAIAELTGNGLFEKSKQAQQETLNAQEVENSILESYENIINNSTMLDDEKIPFEESLIDYWPLKEGLNNEIDTSSAGDLILYKGNLPSSYSEENGALFNSTVLKTKENYVFPDQFTLTMKVKISNEQNFNGYAYIWSQCLPASGYNYANHTNFAGLYYHQKNAICIRNGIFTSAGQQNTSGNFEKDEWLTIIYQYDGNNLNAYVNGNNITSGDYKKTGFRNVSGALYIGGCSYTGTNKAGINWQYIDGYVKDVAVYNKAFSEEELKNLIK